MTIASRTPEGYPARCPVCAKVICLEPSDPVGDAPCPYCGVLLWFVHLPRETRYYEFDALPEATRIRIAEFVHKWFVRRGKSGWSSLGFDSLDVAELLLDIEDEFGAHVTFEEAMNWHSPGDLIDFLIHACEG